MCINPYELAWLAGFTDGDGYFGYSPYSNGLALSFVIGQNGNRSILVRVQKTLGFGRINGPYKRKGRKPNYRFVVNGFEHVQAIAALLWPWLSTVKRKQAARTIAAGKKGY